MPYARDARQPPPYRILLKEDVTSGTELRNLRQGTASDRRSIALLENILRRSNWTDHLLRLQEPLILHDY